MQATEDIIAMLVRRREELGLTQTELAERAGLQQTSVARLERCRVVPRLDMLLRLADVLGLDVRLALR